MKTFLSVILFFFIALDSFGQTDNDEMRNRFNQYLKTEKIDSLYSATLDVTEDEEGYEEALLFRNQNGWALNKVEQLKKDIPAILKLPAYSKEMAYARIFRPQKFPPTEWARFYEISIELEKSFDINSNEYKEILGIKTKLEFLTRNDAALSIDLPKLLALLNKDSKVYPAVLWQYGSLLMRFGDKDKAQKVYESGLKLNSDNDFLSSLIMMYSTERKYDQVIKYEDQITEDSSGALLYFLGEAYLEKEEINKASEYFTLYISKFKYADYEPYVKIKFNNVVHHIRPYQLEKLGDFFQEQEKEQSCKFYAYAKKITENSKSADRFFNKHLMAVQDEDQKKEMLMKFEENKKEQLESLIRIEQKIEKCE